MAGFQILYGQAHAQAGRGDVLPHVLSGLSLGLQRFPNVAEGGESWTRDGEGGMKESRMSNRIWSIVQASGDGGRIRAFIQRWLGRPKPKQYCAFVGGRSPFQHTLDRNQAL